MRTIDEIFDRIIYDKEQSAELAVLNSTSKVAVWRLWAYIVAVAIWTHEQIFAAHRQEIEDLLLLKKPHTARWYAGKAKAFQYGFQLLPDSDVYNPLTPEGRTYTDEQVAASKIVKYAAVTESDTDSRLIVKIATESGGKLSPISDDQKTSFEAYFSEIKDAGTKITVINYRPDKLALNLKIFRDAKIISKTGESILNGTKPVEAALEAFMKELPFDGELVLNSLIDKLQAVPGVVNPHLVSAQTKWIDPSANDYGNYEWINISKIPESGYFEIDWPNTTIEYIAAKTL